MSLLVSIVIPTYQRPHLLKRCLHSLMLQRFLKTAYEVIVISDGPDEQTLRIVNESRSIAGPDLWCYSLPAKKGPAAARNAGWKAAKGKLILFTDDDCIPAVDWIENFHNAFDFYGEPLIAFTGKITVPRSASPTDFELNTAHLETADFVTANCACSKTALEKVNGFDEAFTMAWREDSDLQFRLIKEGIRIKKIDEAEVIHPVRKAPWGVSLKEQKKSMFNALLFKKHPQLYRQKINKGLLWNYYLMIFFCIAFFIAIFLHKTTIALGCFICWFILLGEFTFKRLTNASHSLTHIAEMIATSMLIPFFSIYWNLYGAYKFKVFKL